MSDTIGGDIKCVLGNANTLANEATDLESQVSGNSTAEEILREIVSGVGNFSDPLNGTDNSLLDTIEKGADQLRDTASSARTWTDDAGNKMEAFVYTCLTFVLIVGLCNVGLGAFVAKGEGTRGNCYTTLVCSSGAMICVMWLLLLVCAITFFVLRFEAGYCDDPFAIITSYIGKDDRSDPGTPPPIVPFRFWLMPTNGLPFRTVTYYLSCADMSDAEREQFWPWESERLETAGAYSNITSLIESLQGSGANTTDLEDAADVLGCSVTADFGLLGFNGLFSCSNMQTFVQDVVIQVCTRMYDPLYA